MISHKHKFIFIHVPKTAGTSIEEVLRDESCQSLSGEWDYARSRHAPLNHLTLQELADCGILTPVQLKSYFKFCFVRNPWDRLISEIFCRWMSPWFTNMSVEQRIRHACQLVTTSKGIANHLRLQQDFVTADGLQMDFIGRFEHLEEDFGQLSRLLGMKAVLPHLNRSAHRPYQEYYNEETLALTTATYGRDIDAFHYKFGKASSGRADVPTTQQKVGQGIKQVNTNQKILAYQLIDQPVPLRPAKEQQTWPQPNATYSADLSLGKLNQQAWQLCCPVAFEATWNGGASTGDIEIRLSAEATTEVAFVQSNLGGGLLTFYPGYQFKSEGNHLLWVRGPLNAPKDGLAPLEQIVDAAVLPCTVAIHWQFTCPHHTIRFDAGEPFAVLLLYPQSHLENIRIEMVHLEDVDEDAHEEAFQQMINAPALQSLFQRLGAPLIQPTEQEPNPQKG